MHKRILFFMLALLLAGGVSAHAQDDAHADMIAEVQKTVVNIRTDRHYVYNPRERRAGFLTAFFKDFFESRKPQKQTIHMRSEGSGVFIDASGLILTNAHVVERADKIHVIDHWEHTYAAQLVCRLPVVDLALLRVGYAGDVPVIEFADPETLKAGQDVFALGSPFGLKKSTTKGIISNLDRKLTVGDRVIFERMIQTDAAVNPGNSGGPLINTKGQMVGLLTASFRGAQGLSFALPIEAINQVLPELKRGEDRTAYLQKVWKRYGVLLETAVDEYGDNWLLIYDIDPASEVYRAGVRKEDRIFRLKNAQVRSLDEFQRVDKVINPGDRIELQILRKDKTFFTYLEVL